MRKLLLGGSLNSKEPGMTGEGEWPIKGPKQGISWNTRGRKTKLVGLEYGGGRW